MASPTERRDSEDSNLDSPDPLDSPMDSCSPSLEGPSSPSALRPNPPPHSASTSQVTSSSTPLGPVNAARRPAAPQSTLLGRGGLPPEMEAKMRAFHLGRQGAPQTPSIRSGNMPQGGPGSPSSPKLGPGGLPSNLRMPPGVQQRPNAQTYNSSPAVARGPGQGKPSLAEKRGMQLPGGLGNAQTKPQTEPAAPGGRKRPGLTLSQMNQGDEDGDGEQPSGQTGSLLDKYSDFIDSKTGSLKFKGKATLTNQGIEFTGGKTFNISLDEVDTLDELGKGNYGTVYKVRHSRPRLRRPGLGLAGNKALPQHQQQLAPGPDATAGGTSGVVMAMKEIRLELDDAKFAAIIMELDILHRCVSPYIVDFYGAFFQEGAVYICLEFMDGGSIDKLYAEGIPENVLRKIAYATTQGLRCLKDDHNIIHRDVKPTNILVNTRGQIKICDFGVSGNLVASIAKTNIGCQSYMAPERISGGGVAQAGANPGGGTYSVQSDIWSLGLTLIECALGQYPYPPETYDNIFSQLSAIVDGDPPDLPADRFSEAAHDFVSGCLMKIPKMRPSYKMLLQHAWLAPLVKPATITEEDEEAAEAAAEAGEEMPQGTAMQNGTTMPPVGDQQPADQEVADWVADALEKKRQGTLAKKAKPALHAAPLNAVPNPGQAEAAA